MNWIRNWLIARRFRRCKHVGILDTLERIEDGRVTCVCDRCLKNLYADYGLALPVVGWVKRKTEHTKEAP